MLWTLAFQSPDQWGGYCGGAETGQGARGGPSGFNPLTNGADIVGYSRRIESLLDIVLFQSPDQWGGYCGLLEAGDAHSFSEWADGFNPLTNGADIVGRPADPQEAGLTPHEFQSPDQWGGYCGRPLGHVRVKRPERFNPLTNGADIVGPEGRLWVARRKRRFQSPDQWGGYCGRRLRLRDPIRGAILVSIP